MVKQWLCFQTWPSTPQNSNEPFLLVLPTNFKVETFWLKQRTSSDPNTECQPSKGGVCSTVGKEQMGCPSLASFLCFLQK